MVIVSILPVQDPAWYTTILTSRPFLTTFLMVSRLAPESDTPVYTRNRKQRFGG